MSMPPSFPLPAVHKELSPFIAAPSSVHQTRSLLSSHLHSLSTQPRITSASGSTDEFSRFLDLELSRQPGIRKDYLTALREHAAAKKEHAAALAALHSASSSEDEEDSEGEVEEGEAGWKHAYLEVLRVRRQINRLSVLREGVAVLADSTIERPAQGIQGAYSQAPPKVPEELRPTAKTGEVAEEGENRAELVLRLQKRIVEAGEQLEIESGRVKALREQGGGGDRALALGKVQEELLAWLEKATEVPAAEEGDVVGQEKGKVKDVVRDIDSAYERYLYARTELLGLLRDVNAAPAPLPGEEQERAEATRQLLAGRLDVAPPLPAPQVLRVLAAAEHLVPLVKTQKALLAAQNHHSNAVAKKREEMAQLFPGKKDVVEAAKTRGQEVVRTVALAEKEAWAHVVAGGQKLEEAKKAAVEVDELCAGGKRPQKKKAIPVRGSRAQQQQEEEPPRGVWGALGGAVGVIGDGI
jgi:hypothetical protein